MADDDHDTQHDKAADHTAAAEAKPSGAAEAVIRRPDLRPRDLSHSERETLRARLQKKFH